MPLEEKHDEHKDHPHPHDADMHDHGDHQECPDHFHRCHTRTVSYGYMDCPDHHEPKMVTRFLTVACGNDDPRPQIQNHINMVGNNHDLVTAIADLGHSGWLVTFNHPE